MERPKIKLRELPREKQERLDRIRKGPRTIEKDDILIGPGNNNHFSKVRRKSETQSLQITYSPQTTYSPLTIQAELDNLDYLSRAYNNGERMRLSLPN